MTPPMLSSLDIATIVCIGLLVGSELCLTFLRIQFWQSLMNQRKLMQRIC